VIKGATDNGFSGRYATSVAVSMGSGWKDHLAELRAYGDNWSTKGNAGSIVIRLMKLDENGNRSDVAELNPMSNTYLSRQVSDSKHFRYLDAGYYQELDALFEIQAADVDDDGVDEMSSYTGAHIDRDGERYAAVDMFDHDASS
jgi:hypothetical protein